jgi:hypothetical protein
VVILACVFLHNWLQSVQSTAYNAAEFMDSATNNILVPGNYEVGKKSSNQKNNCFIEAN